MTTDELRPRVGVGVMVLRNGQVLLHRRRGSHGAGEWAFPGGHLEHLESFAECAAREAREECGVALTNVRFLFLANVTAYAPKHYVHVGLVADWAGGEPENREPERGESWGWYALDQLPQPLFAMCRLAFHAYRSGRRSYDRDDVARLLYRPSPYASVLSISEK